MLLEGSPLKKLNAAVDRFARQHPRFGIPNLMLWIVGCNALVYLLTVFAGYGAVSFLAFDWAAIKSGELWRLVTFIFMPGYVTKDSILWLVLFLYFYYMIGSALEREWGTAKFNLYYLSGVVLTILTGVIFGLVNGNAWMTGADYVNLSLFFAFAVLYPETRFLIMFIIPVKVKWLAIVDAVFFALAVITNPFPVNLLPVVAVLNFFLFCGGDLLRHIRPARTSRSTVNFRKESRRIRREQQSKLYTHKCAVCGRTDVDYPNLEFRYCSRCQGYHCFCIDHINNHIHFTE